MKNRIKNVPLVCFWRNLFVPSKVKQISCFFFLYSCAVEYLPPDPPVRVINDSLDIVAGRLHTCMLFYGRVRCWGHKEINGYGTPLGRTRNPQTLTRDLEFPDKDSPVIQITAGLEHTCVLFEDKTVRCWGKGANGKLGTGDTVDIPLVRGGMFVFGGPPMMTLGAENDINFGTDVEIKQIAAGSNHTCALSSDNMIYCWGAGGSGQLGNNPVLDITDGDETPIPAIHSSISGLFPSEQDPVKIAAGSNHTCVYFQNSDIICWGLAEFLGGNSSALTIAVESLSAADITTAKSSLANLEIKDMVAGAGVTCILTNTSRAVCWGVGKGGHLGYGCNQPTQRIGSTDIATPTTPSQDDTFRVAAAPGPPITEPTDFGAIDTNCRGAPNMISYRNYTDVTQIALGPGALHSCVIRAEGDVYCHGLNLGVHGLTARDDIKLGDAKDAACENPVYRGGSPLGYNASPFDLKTLDTSLGLDSLYNITTSFKPVAVGASSTRLGLGEAHVCAIVSGDRVKCWGVNCEGQLGYGPDFNPDTTGGDPHHSVRLDSYDSFKAPF